MTDWFLNWWPILIGPALVAIGVALTVIVARISQRSD